MTNFNDEDAIDELAMDQLDEVNGGAKVVDASSPTLFRLCCTGKHFPKAT